MIPLLVGLFIGIKVRFRHAGWLIPFAVGAVFLLDRALPGLDFKQFITPVIIIAIGLAVIFRPKPMASCSGGRKNRSGPGTALTKQEFKGELDKWEAAMAGQSNVVDATAVFGGVKKNVVSKQFKGGEIVSVMGGTEINLTQADFDGKVIIETFNAFGGTKLIVPANWDVQSQVVAIFGGVDDKRKFNGTPVDANKVLYLSGTCIFGGIEISSY